MQAFYVTVSLFTRTFTLCASIYSNSEKLLGCPYSSPVSPIGALLNFVLDFVMLLEIFQDFSQTPISALFGQSGGSRALLPGGYLGAPV